MKILVLSLLRIGDIVMSARTLSGLRARYPEAEIHLLINAQFQSIAPLLTQTVDRVILFDRDRLQKGLGTAEVPMFDSYERLGDQIDELTGEDYDLTINLTHSRLSGWLMNLIPARERLGLCLDADGRPSFGNGWFHYLNEQVARPSHETFHFTDVFRFALDLEELGPAALTETQAGHAEAEAFMAATGASKESLLVVQALTSDEKKNWGLTRFVAALEQFQNVNRAATVAILAAPFERALLAPFVADLQSRGVRAELAVMSFAGAFSLLKRARLLLTVDTSIKHLAAEARTPVVEISVGSSDPFRTGVYQHGSVILQSREECAPCVHSKPCHRSEHFCAKRVPTELVSMVTSEMFAGRAFQLRTLAEEYRDEARLYRVDTKSAGFWTAPDVSEDFSLASIGRWLELAASRLQVGTGTGLGTETLKLARLVRAIHPQVPDGQWRELLGTCERQAMSLDSEINTVKMRLQYLRGRYEDPQQLREVAEALTTLRATLQQAPQLSPIGNALSGVLANDIGPAFTRFRVMTSAVSELEKRLDIHLRLVRGVAAELTAAKHGIEKT